MSAAPTGLSILVDEKRVNDLLAQKTGLKAVIRQSCNVCLFCTFLGLFTLLALGEPFSYNRAFEAYIRRRFDSMAAMRLDEVDSITDFWRYTNVSLMPGIYGNDTRQYTYPGYVLEKMLPMPGANRLFGVARLRMLKVKPDEQCTVESTYTSAFPMCYGPYLEAAEDTESFGPIADTGEAEFRWYPPFGGDPYPGKIAEYPASGFMEVLTSNYNSSYYRLRMLEESSWVSENVRALFYEFTIYNFNVGLYAVCNIAFEVSPNGRWTKTFHVDILMQRHLAALGQGETGDWLVLVGEAVLMLFALRYLMEEASEFMGCEARGEGKMKVPTVKWEYFTDAWNLLDWANLILILATLGVRVSTWGKASGVTVFVGDPAMQGVSTFTDLYGVALNVKTIHQLVAINSVLAWFKAVKYINFIPYITTFMTTVTVAQRQLFSFVVVFLVTLVAFTLGYNIAFGETLSQFRTPWRSMVFLMRTLIGDGEMEQVYKSDALVGSLLIVVYVIAMFFVVMNLFYAIMISALADAKQTEDQKSVKRYQANVERAQMIWDGIKEQFKLEQSFRMYLPGLYSRLMTRKKKQEDKEKERDEALLFKEKAKSIDEMLALGPGAPTCGRRKKRPAATISAVSLEDEDMSDDDASEPDLGPLRSADQITRTGEVTFGGSGGFIPIQDKNAEPTPEAIDLVIDATRHIAAGIVERTRGARGVLFAEMAESKEVLQGVANVLEVLGRRARDLEAQQRQLLKHY